MQAWLEIERATTKLEEGRNTRFVVFGIGTVFAIPYIIFLIVVNIPYLVNRYGPLFFLFVGWPAVFHCSMGVLCIVVCTRFLRRLDESTKIQIGTRSKMKRVNIIHYFSNRIKLPHNRLLGVFLLKVCPTRCRTLSAHRLFFLRFSFRISNQEQLSILLGLFVHYLVNQLEFFLQSSSFIQLICMGWRKFNKPGTRKKLQWEVRVRINMGPQSSRTLNL